METDRIAENVLAFIVARFPSARGRAVGLDDDLLACGILDSLGVLTVATYLQREFGVRLLTEDYVTRRFESLGRIAALVAQRRGLMSSDPA